MLKLDQKLSVYVPSNVNGEVNKELQAYWVKQFQTMLCRFFGGCTCVNAQGCWMSNDEIITEDVVIVSAHYDYVADVPTISRLNEVFYRILEMKDAMKQEAVSYEKNGVLTII